MRGSIQKKGKRWYAVVYDGVNPETGQYRRRWVPAGTRRGDAEKLLAELVKRSHQGETVVSEKLTLGEYLTKRWLPVHGWQNCAYDVTRASSPRDPPPSVAKYRASSCRGRAQHG